MFREVLCQAHCLHRLAAAMLRQWAVGWCAIHSNAIQVPRCLVMTEVDRNWWSHRADLCLPAAAVCRCHQVHGQPPAQLTSWPAGARLMFWSAALQLLQ